MRDRVRRAIRPAAELVPPGRAVKEALPIGEDRGEPLEPSAPPASRAHELVAPGRVGRQVLLGEEHTGRDPGLVDRVGELESCGELAGDRLLEQQVLAEAGGPERDALLDLRRHGEDHEIDRIQEGVEVVERDDRVGLAVQLAHEVRGLLTVSTPHRREGRALNRGEGRPVGESGPGPGADEAGAKGHAVTLPVGLRRNPGQWERWSGMVMRGPCRS